MTKDDALSQLIDHLRSEIGVLTQSARAAHSAATHEESKAEDKHDTFAIEASYLAAGQSTRVLELEATLQELEGYREGSLKADQVRPGALVCFSQNKIKTWVLFAVQGGGTKVEVSGIQIQILSRASPLGQELEGLRVGDEVEMELNPTTLKTLSIIEIQ